MQTIINIDSKLYRQNATFISKKQLVAYDSSLDCIVCDMIEDIFYDKSDAIVFDFRGVTSGFKEIDGDLDTIDLIAKEGMCYVADNGSRVFMKTHINKGGHSYADYRIFTPGELLPDSLKSYKMYSCANWPYDFSLSVVTYGPMIIVCEVREKVIENTVRYYFDKKVSINTLGLLTGLTLNVYVRMLCNLNKDSDNYGYIVQNYFEGSRWNPGPLGFKTAEALPFLNRGGRLSMVYCGAGSIEMRSVNPTTILINKEEPDIKINLIQTSTLSQVEVYSSILIESRFRKATRRNLDTLKNIEEDEIKNLIAQYGLDFEQVRNRVRENEERLSKMAKYVPTVENLLLNETCDQDLIFGVVEDEESPFYIKSGHAMMSLLPLFRNNLYKRILEMPVDFRELNDEHRYYTVGYNCGDNINSPTFIPGNMTEVSFYIRDEDLLFAQVRPELSLLYDINENNPTDFGPEGVFKEAYIYTDRLEYNPIATGHWVKVRSGYTITFKIRDSVHCKRLRLRTIVLVNDTEQWAKNEDVGFSRDYSHFLFMSYTIKYVMNPSIYGKFKSPMDGINRVGTWTGWRTGFDLRDWPKGNRACGFNLPSTYKGPFLFAFWTWRSERIKIKSAVWIARVRDKFDGLVQIDPNR